MAPKDYAQRGGSRSHTRISPPMPGWVWLVAGLSMGLAVAAFVYIARPAPERGAVGEIPVMATKEPPPERKKVELPPKEKSRFSFYELLPSYEVMIPRSKTKAGDPPPIAEPGTYIIQVGSFKNETDAEKQKANLALLGIESKVERVTIDNRETWFRVRIGPVKDLARVHSMLSLLEENRIESFLVRVKG